MAYAAEVKLLDQDKGISVFIQFLDKKVYVNKTCVNVNAPRNSFSSQANHVYDA